jgi:hypothetical protein
MTQICQVMKPTAQILQNNEVFKETELWAWHMTESSQNTGGGWGNIKETENSHRRHNKFTCIKSC